MPGRGKKWGVANDEWREKNKEKRFNTEGTESKEAHSGQLTANRHSCGFFQSSVGTVQAEGGAL
jgi:hypothetical protein